MSIELITVIILLAIVVALALGFPIAFVLGGVAVTSVVLFLEPQVLGIVVQSIWGIMSSVVLVAVPMFIAMGIVLQKAGIADDLFDVVYHWIGHIRGGLAIGTVGVCVVIAALSGVSGAATVSMGIIALPIMLRRGYDKIISVGTIQAAGALGFLIPPSVLMIVYAAIAKVSVGRLFVGGIFPGLLLAMVYIMYITIRCRLQPRMGPASLPEERSTWREKLMSLRGIILPVALIFLVLGSILVGVASPTEASCLGVAGSLICAAVKRKLSWTLVKEASYQTMRLSGMIIWLAFGAMCLSKVYGYLGSTELMESAIMLLPGGRWGILIFMQLSFFILGCFLDDGAILFMVMPIYTGIILDMGFDPVWFGVLVIINMQTSYLTPPFGYNLFYMKGVTSDLFKARTVSEEIRMVDIYRSIFPYIPLQLLGLVLCMLFPQIVLWLPNLIFE